MEITKMRMSDIHPYGNNAKNHPDTQIQQIMDSIREFGNNDPIAVDEEGVIIEGHGRYTALKRLGYRETEVIVLKGLNEDQKNAYRLVHNQLTMNSGFDMDALKAELEKIEMDLTEFDLNLDDLADDDPIIEEDDVPEIDDEKEPIAKYGDVYRLGNHFLMCGDSTNMDDIEKLLSGGDLGKVRPDMVFTDPPYNVAFNGRSGNFDVIENDDLSDDDFRAFIKRIAENIKYLEPSTYYIWCNWKFYGLLQEMLDFKACIVWAKNNFGMGRGYRHQHEFCLFNGSIDDDITNESDLWEVKKDTNYLHPTQKPVELCGRALKNHKKSKIILDLFGGSGSTLIACEQLNRVCYMMELDPRYCDVIIERWERFTGKKAEKEK